ncbi:hypothetical protein SIO70_02145 [Chitinophaga sancti]|uniref:hypothetical protein n=1 Tax=Chitinophaga sancti TaxID=1004 RepID=UPI002A75CD02|nr:hypothetical protein [Chitinophaga sancti]WPQ63662.1 hypothetical protein SIO70_02145 [Chitinophaga sancti]
MSIVLQVYNVSWLHAFGDDSFNIYTLFKQKIGHTTLINNRLILIQHTLIRDYIKKPITINQITSGISLVKTNNQYLGSDYHYSFIAKLLCENYNRITHVMLYRKENNDKDATFKWAYYPNTKPLLIEYALDDFLFNHLNCVEYKQFIIAQFQNYLSNFKNEFNQLDLLGFFNVFKILQPYLKYDEFDLVSVVGEKMLLLSNLIPFFKFEEYCPSGYKQYVENPKNLDSIFTRTYYLTFQRQKKELGARSLTLMMMQIFQRHFKMNITDRYPFVSNDFSQSEIESGEHPSIQTRTKQDKEERIEKKRNKNQIRIAERHFVRLFK